MAFSRSCGPPAAWRLRLMLAASAVLLLASLALMAGATYAWFSESVTNEGNVIRAADAFGGSAPASAEPQVELLSDASDAPADGPAPPDDQPPESQPPPEPEGPPPSEAPPAEEGEGAVQQGSEDPVRLEDGG